MQGRFTQQKSIYVAFVDFKKTFDGINRDLLFYTLIVNGINNEFYFSMRSWYCQTSMWMLTEWLEGEGFKIKKT